MRTTVNFRSKKFPSYQSAEEGPNWDSDVFGKRLAEYLQDALPKFGVKIRTIYAEDFGWQIEIDHDEKWPMCLSCASTDEDCFQINVEPAKPNIRRGLKKIFVGDHVAAVMASLDQILAADPDISDIHWL